MQSGGLPSGIRGALIALAIGAAVVVAVGEVATVNTIWCDGAYPRYRLPDTYRGGGCSRILPAWHGVLPWNWDDHETVCLSVCLNVPLRTPDE